jgi:DNA primase catalytic core
MLDRRDAWHTSPVSPDRLLEVNRQALQFYRAQYTPQCWSRAYLTERLGVDLADDPRFQPGHAPNRWTALTHHLRQLGVTHEEMELAGLVSRTRGGRIIDRFRNRLILPIVHNTEILGFVARRHPDHGDDHPYAGPKYLNTPDTLLYSKGAQLYGPAGNAAPQAVPVLVEGPLDAIAITLASSGRHLGYAPLGTSLTSEQAAQLANMGHSAPIVATDHDIPGQMAAERAYWQLTLHGLDPRHATWSPGSDPADTLHTEGAAAIQTALHNAQPLADTLIDDRLCNLPTEQAGPAAIDILAARPGPTWTNPLATIAARTGTDPERLRGQLRNRIRDWINDPRHTAEHRLAQLQLTKARLTSAANADPVIRWQDLANRTDPRLTRQSDWPALANMMQAAHRQGLDLDATVADLTKNQPLNHRPAQDLRYRMASIIDLRALDNPATQASVTGHAPTQRRSPHDEARSRRPRNSELVSRSQAAARGPSR